MSKRPIDEVILKIQQASGLRYQLVLVIGPEGVGKTTVLQEVKARIGAPLINVSLELSKRMLDLTERQRILHIPRLLDEITNHTTNEIILLDNLELLFDMTLRQDPLQLLKSLSRNHTVVAAWNGSVENDYLTYAVPRHPEYRRYQMQDFLMIDLTATQ
jgi:ABC-type hemin transport system ATPase subunit